MAEQIPELFESLESLGEIVTRLSAARDAAQAGDRSRMDGWIGSAERFVQAFNADCRVICEIREDEQCGA